MKNMFYFFIIICNLVSAQTNYDLFRPDKNYIPTSPEIALFERFGNIPVDLYKGVSNVNIPLFSFKVGKVDIPINLMYITEGIKVMDEATWAGLGWNLLPEGTIIQEVRGIQDSWDYFPSVYGYSVFKNNFGYNPYCFSNYNYRYQIDNEYTFVCTSSNENYNPGTGIPNADQYEVIDKLNQGFGEPDMFHFNFMGHTGTFFINPENQSINFVNTSSEIKFELINNKWKATTQDGTQYYFNEIEQSNLNNPNDPHNGLTHKLTNVTTIDNKTINFIYTTETYTKNTLDQSWDLYNFDIINQDPSPNGIVYTAQKKSLLKIENSDILISFNLNNRDDILNCKKLESIDITDKLLNKPIKKIKFHQTYFPYNTIGDPTNVTSYQQKRLKLDSIQILGYDNTGILKNESNTYKFEYDLSITMPSKFSYAQDFWGFYNGKPNTHLIPDLRYFDYEYDSRYRNYVPWVNLLSSQSLTVIDTFSYFYTGANRFTDTLYSKSYTLKKIIYPTKGYSEFHYNSNIFNNDFIPDNSQVENSFKVTTLIESNWSSNLSYNFKPNKDATIQFQNRIFDGTTQYSGQDCSYEEMMGSEICFYKIISSPYSMQLIKKWDLTNITNANFTANHGVYWNEKIRLNYDANPNVSYLVTVHKSSSCPPSGFTPGAYVESKIQYFDDTNVNKNYSKGAGIRISKIINYNANNSIGNSKLFTYQGGKLLFKFEPLNAINSARLNCYGPGQGCFNGLLFNRIIINSNEFGCNENNPIGYDISEEIDYTGNYNNGKTINYFHNIVNQTKKGIPSILNVINGKLSKQEIYNDQGNKLSEKVYTYFNIYGNNSYYYGFKSHNISIGNTCAYGSCITGGQSQIPYLNFRSINISNLEMTQLGNKWAFSSYPIFKSFIVVDSIISSDFFNGNQVTSITKYNYNNSGNVSQIKTYSSLNEKLFTNYYYANSPEMASEPKISELNTNNMVGIPLRTDTYRGTEKLSEEKTQYAKDVYTSNLLLPKYIWSKKGTDVNAVLEKKITFDLYDDKGNLKQYTTELGQPVSIVWGYNKTLPIAKIEGIAYSTLETSPLSTLLNNAINASNATGSLYVELTLQTALDNLRNDTALDNSFITSYTHKPLIGISTVKDPKGDKLTYTYDFFNRLEFIKDLDGKIINQYEYHYKN